MALPTISHEQLLSAIRRFDAEERATEAWLGWEDRPKHKWAITFEGKRYPVKHLISTATGVPTADFSGGPESNQFLQALGFQVTPLRSDSISALFEQVLAGYLDARKTAYSGSNPIARAVQSIARVLGGVPETRAWERVQVNASTGAGNWATVPWVALMDSDETRTTQKGVYCVYLFRADMQGVYLTLNQGVTELRQERGLRGARQAMREIVLKLRNTLGALTSQGFKLDDDMKLATENLLGVGYEEGCIVYKYYPAGAVPDDEKLLGDLTALLKSYNGYMEAKKQVTVAPNHFEVLVERFRAEFPDFQDFSHQTGKYYEQEREYKDDMVAVFGRFFVRDKFQSAESDVDSCFAAMVELLQRPLPSKRKPQNLIGWQSLTFLKRIVGGQRTTFVKAVGDLLFGQDDVPSRIDRFSEIADPIVHAVEPSAGSSPIRGFATLLLMLSNPTTHIFVRAKAANRFAKLLLGHELVSGPLTGAQYTEVQDLYADALSRLRAIGWNPRDMIDAQSFVWRALEEQEAIDVPESLIADVPSLAAVYVGLVQALQAAGLRFDPAGVTIRSFLTSLITKRFVILTGLSGSGKTQLALRFGEWLGPKKSLVVAVRPDWTGSEFLFGYEDALLSQSGGRRAWHVPSSLKFMLEASKHPDKPYLLLLDEMNLAHVERYFADVLSGMESREDCLPNLQQEEDGYWREPQNGPATIPFPRNMFIVGTVNVDETTYMFSPKVLDRANTFEFRVETSELAADARVPGHCAPGADEAVVAVLGAAMDDTFHLVNIGVGAEAFATKFRDVHSLLSHHGFEFGHRVYYEAIRFAAVMAATGEARPDMALDLQILQKVLPRIHGARRTVEPVLLSLAEFCYHGTSVLPATQIDPLSRDRSQATLPRSFVKVCRMLSGARANQFTSFTG